MVDLPFLRELCRLRVHRVYFRKRLRQTLRRAERLNGLHAPSSPAQPTCIGRSLSVIKGEVQREGTSVEGGFQGVFGGKSQSHRGPLDLDVAPSPAFPSPQIARQVTVLGQTLDLRAGRKESRSPAGLTQISHRQKFSS